MASDYSTTALSNRIKLKAFTSTSSALSDQDILDLCNDSLRSYVVPILKTLREEFLVTQDDIVVTTDSDGKVSVPDSVASTLRLIAWNNGGTLTQLVRIEPEQSFQYLAMDGSLPMGFQMRGYIIQLLPKVPNIELHLNVMRRPPQLTLTALSAEVSSRTGPVLTLAKVPVEWQASAPTSVEVISSTSPFADLGEFDVSSLVGSTLTLTTDPGQDDIWCADVGTSPFAMVPIELYPLLEQDVIVQLFTGLGDMRLAGAAKRRDELEKKIIRTMAPRTTGSARPIVNNSAPGIRSIYGYWPRR